MLELGFAHIPAQHPASSTFADAFPISMQAQPIIRTYSPIPSQQYSGDHTLQKPSLEFPPSQTSQPWPEYLQALSSTRCLPHTHDWGWAASSGQEAVALSCLLSAHCSFLSLSKQGFQISLAAPCFPLLSCFKGSKMFFPLGTSSGIN